MAEPDTVLVQGLRAAAGRLVELGAAARWRGADPYDGLFVRWPKPLVGGRRRRQAIVQMHARSPLDIRRAYRRRHSLVPKAPALLGQAACRLLATGEDERPRELARDALQTLCDDRTCGRQGWGYPWDTQTRWSHYPGGSPNIVATAFCANALAEGAATLAEPAWRTRAERAAEWVADELFLAHEGYFAYHGHSDRLVHNANLLGAALVHELAPPDHGGAQESVRLATARTLDAQRADGTWPYGEGAGLEWVDSFHTGYVLDSLCRLEDVDPRIPQAIERGASVYLSCFFGEDGRSTLWRGKRFPVDSHSAGTGMTVLSRLASRGAVPIEAVRRVAGWTLAHLLHANGHAIFRRERWGATRVYYTRWCDAPVALGFASAAALLDRSPLLEPSALGRQAVSEGTGSRR